MLLFILVDNRFEVWNDVAFSSSQVCLELHHTLFLTYIYNININVLKKCHIN